MGKFDDFDKYLQKEREEAIQKAKDGYVSMTKWHLISVCVWFVLVLICIFSREIIITLAIIGIIIYLAVGIPFLIGKTKEISELNKIMTIEEKVKFFGSQAKYHSLFKTLITFDSIVPLNSIFEDKSKKHKHKKRVCTYCGGEISEDDEDCPGCGSRQFEDK